MKNIIVSTQPSWLPVLKQLDAKAYQLIALQPQFTKLLHDIDLPAKSLGEYLTDTDRSQALRDASRLHVQLASQPAMPMAHSTAVSDWLVNNGVARYFYPRLIDLSLALAALQRAEAKLLILHNDVEPIHRLLALYAIQHGIPVLHIPHAIYLDSAERGPLGSDIHDVVTADYLAAAGPFQAQWYRARSATQKIYLTGLPQFDRLAGRTRKRDAACKLLRLDPYKPVLVYMSSWSQNTNLLGCHSGVEETYHNLLSALHEFKELQLVVKCHPRGNNVEWHMQEAAKTNLRCVVTAEHLDTTLMAADVVLSYGPSNVVLEAASIPNLRVAVTDGFDDDPEILTIGSATKELMVGIATALTQPAPDMSRLLHKYLGQLDGQAAMRIANLIRKLVE